VTLTLVPPVGDADALRDLRHLDARAAPDLADWLVSLEVGNKADRTIHAYRLEIARLLRANMDKRVQDYSPSDIERWIIEHPRRSRHISRAIASAFFTWLYLQERIEKNPMDKVVKVRAAARQPTNIFTEAERALLEALPAPHGHCFSLLFGSGMRRDEAIRLQWGHVDLDRERLIVRHGKGDKPRIVPLLDFALVAVAELDGFERFNRDDYLFFKTRGPNGPSRYREKHSRHESLSTSAFQRWYGDCITEAGVTYRKPHTTRHTYNEILRQQNYDLEERQLLLGHESSRTTADIYGHLTIEDVALKMRANH
jgi:integrase/recombinase XerD